MPPDCSLQPWLASCSGLFGSSLDDRNELHPLGAQLVAEEAVDPPPVVLVGGVDRAQDIEFDAVPLQCPPTLHDAIERASLAAVDPVRIVEFARPIDAQTDQKIVLLEEGAPFVIQKDAVGLKGMLHDLICPPVFFHELDRVAEELDLHQRRLSALPRHRDLGRPMRLEQLTDVGLERRRRHAVLLVRVERVLG